MTKPRTEEQLSRLFEETYNLRFEYRPEKGDRAYRLIGSEADIKVLAAYMNCPYYKKGERYFVAFGSPKEMNEAHNNLLSNIEVFERTLNAYGIASVKREDRKPEDLPFRLCVSASLELNEPTARLDRLRDALNAKGIHTMISESPKDGVFIGFENYYGYLHALSLSKDYLVAHEGKPAEVELPPIYGDGRGGR